MMFITEPPTKALEEYIGVAEKYLKDMGGSFEAQIKQTVSYINSGFDISKQASIHRELEQKWYDSLKEGSPDYSVYDHDFYLVEAWACWAVYSRRYIRDLFRKGWFDRIQPTTIVDLGCGTGLSTAAFSDLFPDATVYGTNLNGTVQWSVASEYASKYGFKLVGDIDMIDGSVDFLFASEYFEHFEESIPHLHEVVEKLQPKYLAVANGYNGRAIGHFQEYQPNNIPAKKMPRLFGQTMRSLGYEKMKTGLFNDRPAMWAKGDWSSLY